MTQREVATIIGVSPATVGRFLKEDGGLQPHQLAKRHPVLLSLPSGLRASRGGSIFKKWNTDAQRRAFALLSETNSTLRQVAEKTGVSTATIRRFWKKSNGVPKSPEIPHNQADDVQDPVSEVPNNGNDEGPRIRHSLILVLHLVKKPETDPPPAII